MDGRYRRRPDGSAKGLYEKCRVVVVVVVDIVVTGIEKMMK
jgi:hypothetical protein